MQDVKNTSSIEKGRPVVTSKQEVHNEVGLLPELENAQLSVSESLSVLGEGAEVITVGELSEEEKKSKSTYAGTIDSTGQAGRDAAVVLPKIEMMIEQTVQAIENELKVKKDEVRVLIRKHATPHELNDLIRRIRFLHGLLYQLQRAAKLAEEFIVGLWKQFVNKA